MSFSSSASWTEKSSPSNLMETLSSSSNSSSSMPSLQWTTTTTMSSMSQTSPSSITNNSSIPDMFEAHKKLERELQQERTNDEHLLVQLEELEQRLRRQQQVFQLEQSNVESVPGELVDLQESVSTMSRMTTDSNKSGNESNEALNVTGPIGEVDPNNVAYGRKADNSSIMIESNMDEVEEIITRVMEKRTLFQLATAFPPSLRSGLDQFFDPKIWCYLGINGGSGRSLGTNTDNTRTFAFRSDESWQVLQCALETEAKISGNAQIQVLVGEMYMKGLGVSQDLVQANKWFRLAANQGNAQGRLKILRTDENRLKGLRGMRVPGEEDKMHYRPSSAARSGTRVNGLSVIPHISNEGMTTVVDRTSASGKTTVGESNVKREIMNGKDDDKVEDDIAIMLPKETIDNELRLFFGMLIVVLCCWYCCCVSGCGSDRNRGKTTNAETTVVGRDSYRRASGIVKVGEDANINTAIDRKRRNKMMRHRQAKDNGTSPTLSVNEKVQAIQAILKDKVSVELSVNEKVQAIQAILKDKVSVEYHRVQSASQKGVQMVGWNRMEGGQECQISGDFGFSLEQHESQEEVGANLCNAEANYTMGVTYYKGRGVKQDYAKAMERLLLAAVLGHTDAHYNIGVMHAKGRGVDQDYTLAATWYQLAANRGCARAQISLAALYRRGDGVTQDYNKAMEWYLVAAHQGCIKAQYNLGVMHEKGEGVARNYNEAVEWYQVAADQGYAKAQYNLGSMYRDGKGVWKDHNMAFDWYQRAAAQGLAEAQTMLEILGDVDLTCGTKKSAKLWRKVKSSMMFRKRQTDPLVSRRSL